MPATKMMATAGALKQAKAEQSKKNPNATSVDQKIGNKVSAKKAGKHQPKEKVGRHGVPPG